MATESGSGLVADADKRILLIMVMLIGGASGGGALIGSRSDPDAMRRVIREEMATLSYGQQKQVDGMIERQLKPIEYRLGEAERSIRRRRHSESSEDSRALGLAPEFVGVPAAGTGG